MLFSKRGEQERRIHQMFKQSTYVFEQRQTRRGVFGAIACVRAYACMCVCVCGFGVSAVSTIRIYCNIKPNT